MGDGVSCLPDDIRAIDTLHLGRPHVVASYLLLGDEPALVDPGPASVLVGLEAGLATSGLRVEDLSALLLTHIHLDHAGATGVLMRRNPRLRVFVHHRGAPHMLDPERLLRSARRLYGERMDELWGEFLPTPAERVTTLAGGETIALGRRRIDVYDAPGHAVHHVVYHEPASGALWAGDDAGVRLPGATYVQPATPPPDIDLEAWDETWAAFERLAPRLLLLTHFGAYDDPARHIAELRGRTRRWSEVVRAGVERGGDDEALAAELIALASAELAAHPDADRAGYGQAAAVGQCWQGLARYWRKRLGLA